MAEHRDLDLQRLFELDAGPGPARSIDDARFSAIIAGALGGAGFPPPVGPGGGAGAAQGGAKVAASTAAKGLAAGKLTVLIGGALTATAAAVVWIALRAPAGPPPVLVSPASISSASSVGAAPSTPADPPPSTIRDDAPAVEPVSPHATREEAPAVAAAPAIAPGERRPSAITAGPAHPSGASSGGRRRRPKPTVPPAEDPAPIVAPRTPDDLLAEANAARSAHRWRDADALYARVASGEPAGLAAQTALVASASIHLEHLGDPAGAARRFRAALAAGPRAALAEDAHWGLAEVARVTGDSAAERRALDDFLAHHAGSPRAPRARARRIELGAAP